MAIATKHEAFQIVVKHHDMLATFGVTRYGLFGSFARDESRRDSDIDILVEFSAHRNNLDNTVRLVACLKETLDRRVDLFTVESFSPHLRRPILQEIEFVALKAWVP